MISRASRTMRPNSQGGARPVCSGSSASPVRLEPSGHDRDRPRQCRVSRLNPRVFQIVARICGQRIGQRRQETRSAAGPVSIAANRTARGKGSLCDLLQVRASGSGSPRADPRSGRAARRWSTASCGSAARAAHRHFSRCMRRISSRFLSSRRWLPPMCLQLVDQMGDVQPVELAGAQIALPAARATPADPRRRVSADRSSSLGHAMPSSPQRSSMRRVDQARPQAAHAASWASSWIRPRTRFRRSAGPWSRR